MDVSPAAKEIVLYTMLIEKTAAIENLQAQVNKLSNEIKELKGEKE